MSVGGDHRQFLEATLPHADVIYNLACHLAADRWQAEDLVQETYLHAYAAFASHRGACTRSWLVAICLNLGRSEVRRLGRRPREILDPNVGLDMAGSENVGDLALASVERRAVARAIARLPLEQRLSLALVDICGLTAREAAEVMGCPRGTVLARVHRGRRGLAQLLEHEGMSRERP